MSGYFPRTAADVRRGRLPGRDMCSDVVLKAVY